MKLEDFKIVYTDYKKYVKAPEAAIIKLAEKTVELCIREIYGNVGFSYVNDFIAYNESVEVISEYGSFAKVHSIEDLWCLLESYRLSDYFKGEVIKENKEIKQSSNYHEYDLGWGPI